MHKLNAYASKRQITKSIKLIVFCLFLEFLFAIIGCKKTFVDNIKPSVPNIKDSSNVVKGTENVIKKGSLFPIKESSGLEYTDGKLWTHEDSGNSPNLYSIDTTNGQILQTIVVDNFQNIDWEDITSDENYLYIADCGNNHGTRQDLRVLKIAKSDIGNQKNEHVNAQSIQFSYQDQLTFAPDNQTNFDCESIVSVGDSLFLFTKNRGNYMTKVYALSKLEGKYQLLRDMIYNVGGQVTGADYDPVSQKVILIGYGGSMLNSFLVFIDGFNSNKYLNSNWKKVTIGNNYTEWKTEGITFLDSNHVFISCESTPPTSSNLYSLDLLGL